MTMARAQGESFRLRDEPDFARFWTGQSISLIGSEITSMAIPVIAILSLGAGALDQGVLFFCQFLPALLFGLHFGTLIDRFAKRSLLVYCDLARMVLLLAIAVLHVLDALSIAALVVIAFLVGTFSVLSAICGQAYVPDLLRDNRLLDGNTKLQKVTTFAEVSGGSLAGALVQALTAPFAVIVDAVSYAVSACFISRVRLPGRVPDTEVHEKPQIWEGLRFVLRGAKLRAITLCAATSNFFSAMMVSLYLLFVMDGLGLSPLLAGLLLSAASCTALATGLLTSRVTARLGVSGALVAGQAVMAAGCLILPFAQGPLPLVSVYLVASHGIFVIGMIVFSTTQLTYRQQVTPARMQGRVHAGNYVITYGAYALGAMAGGLAGEWIGIRPTLVIGALGHILAAAWLLPRRVRITAEDGPATGPERRPDGGDEDESRGDFVHP
ncbi:MFS transporter [Nonomuraea sp. B1E8]|uniref:MFS transporter n=1 Tax=unclassified Nonomuraea TaxID=2593643 RepID=UPI00325E1FD3